MYCLFCQNIFSSNIGKNSTKYIHTDLIIDPRSITPVFGNHHSARRHSNESAVSPTLPEEEETSKAADSHDNSANSGFKYIDRDRSLKRNSVQEHESYLPTRNTNFVSRDVTRHWKYPIVVARRWKKSYRCRATSRDAGKNPIVVARRHATLLEISCRCRSMSCSRIFIVRVNTLNNLAGFALGCEKRF
jgi:hypothetical protein